MTFKQINTFLESIILYIHRPEWTIKKKVDLTLFGLSRGREKSVQWVFEEQILKILPTLNIYLIAKISM